METHILIILMVAITTITLLNYERIKRKNKFLKEEFGRIKKRSKMDAYKHQIALKEQKMMLEKQKHEIQSQTDSLVSLGEELFQISEEKSKVLNVLSHDLRSPINTVIGLIKLFRKEFVLIEDKQTDYLSKMLEACYYQLEMIEKLLDISAIETKQSNIKLESIDLNQELRSVIERQEIFASRKDLEIEYYNHSNGSITFADPNFTKCIFENLLSNAIKFSPPGKLIIVQIQEIDSHYKISFIDQGPGVSKEDQPKLFKKFTKLSARPTGGETSSGLGLALVKSYAHAMNCTVGYQPAGASGGANFFVTFKGVGHEILNSAS